MNIKQKSFLIFNKLLKLSLNFRTKKTVGERKRKAEGETGGEIGERGGENGERGGENRERGGDRLGVDRE